MLSIADVDFKDLSTTNADKLIVSAPDYVPKVQKKRRSSSGSASSMTGSSSIKKKSKKQGSKSSTTEHNNNNNNSTENTDSPMPPTNHERIPAAEVVVKKVFVSYFENALEEKTVRNDM